MNSAYFGALSERRKKNWNNGDDKPYEVLDSPICLEQKSSDLLIVGNKYFREQIQIDWGSYAWKCTSEEIIRFLNEHKTALPWLLESDVEMIEHVKQYIAERKDEEFGVVFIEEY